MHPSPSAPHPQSITPSTSGCSRGRGAPQSDKNERMGGPAPGLDIPQDIWPSPEPQTEGKVLTQSENKGKGVMVIRPQIPLGELVRPQIPQEETPKLSQEYWSDPKAPPGTVVRHKFPQSRRREGFGRRVQLWGQGSLTPQEAPAALSRA